jgi:hypothetical protein
VEGRRARARHCGQLHGASTGRGDDYAGALGASAVERRSVTRPRRRPAGWQQLVQLDAGLVDALVQVEVLFGGSARRWRTGPTVARWGAPASSTSNGDGSVGRPGPVPGPRGSAGRRRSPPVEVRRQGGEALSAHRCVPGVVDEEQPSIYRTWASHRHSSSVSTQSAGALVASFTAASGPSRRGSARTEAKTTKAATPSPTTASHRLRSWPGSSGRPGPRSARPGSGRQWHLQGDGGGIGGGASSTSDGTPADDSAARRLGGRSPWVIDQRRAAPLRQGCRPPLAATRHRSPGRRSGHRPEAVSPWPATGRSWNESSSASTSAAIDWYLSTGSFAIARSTMTHAPPARPEGGGLVATPQRSAAAVRETRRPRTDRTVPGPSTARPAALAAGVILSAGDQPGLFVRMPLEGVRVREEALLNWEDSSR